MSAFLKNEIKNGVSDVNFEIYEHIQILVKKQGWFYSDFNNLCQLYPQSWLSESIKILFESCFKNS